MSTPRRYELTDFEWSIIQPLLPNKPRGKPRVDDRKVLNGIYWRLRTGSPWDDIPERYGPPTTCANRFRRWAKIGVCPIGGKGGVIACYGEPFSSGARDDTSISLVVVGYKMTYFCNWLAAVAVVAGVEE